MRTIALTLSVLSAACEKPVKTTDIALDSLLSGALPSSRAPAEESAPLDDHTALRLLLIPMAVEVSQYDQQAHDNDGYGTRAAQPHVHWLPNPGILDGAGFMVNHAEYGVYTRVLSTATFRAGDTLYGAALFEHASPGWVCEECGVSVGAALFARRARQWVVAARVFHLADIGNGGTGAGERALTQIGPERYAFTLESRSVADLAAYRFLHVINLWPGPIAASRAFELDGAAAQPCGSSSECWSYESSYGFEPGPGRDWFELIIRTRGTGLDGDAVQPRAQQERYSVRDGVYVRMEE